MKNRYFTCLGILFSVLLLTASTARSGECTMGEVSPDLVEVEPCDDEIPVDPWAPVTCDGIDCGGVGGSAVVDKVFGEESPTSISVELTGHSSSGTKFSIPHTIAVIYPPNASSGGNSNPNKGGGGTVSSGASAASLHWWVSLGKTQGNKVAGRLTLDSESPDRSLYAPETLVLQGMNALDVVYDPNVTSRVWQINAPECFVSITNKSEQAYDILFYAPDQVIGKHTVYLCYVDGLRSPYPVIETNPEELNKYDVVLTNEWYELKSGAAHYTVFTVENPDGTNACNRLRITENSNGNMFEREFSWQDGEWSLSEGGGLWKTDLTTTSANGLTVKTWQVSGKGIVSSTTQKTYIDIDGQSLPIEIVTDPLGAALTTTLTYYTNTNDSLCRGRRKTQISPDGSWEAFEYDSTGHRSTIRSGWLDGSPEDDSRIKTYSYAPFLSTNNYPAGMPFDDGKTDRNTPRVETVSIAGVPVSKTLRSIALDAMGYRIIEEVRLLDPTVVDLVAAWEDSANPHTFSQYMPENNFKPCSRQPELIIRADGTTTHYDYIDGFCTNGVNGSVSDFELVSGGPHFRTTITHGTKESFAVSADGFTTNRYCGIPGRTTREVIIATKIDKLELQRETYVCTAPDTYERVSWSTTTRDDFGRVVATHSSNGTTTEKYWNTANQLAYEISADGIRTDYTYDGLGRRSSASYVDPVSGLTSQSLVAYDAEGRVLSSTVSSGDLSQITTNRYDGAGRLAWTRSPDGIETAYENGFTDAGLPYSSTIHGFGTALASTNTTVRHKDGQIAYTEFNGIRKSTYAYGFDAANPGIRWTYTYTGPLAENSPVWTCSTSDALGRTIEERRPGFGGSVLVTANSYNTAGKLLASTQSRLDGAAPVPSQILSQTLYSYDALGASSVSAQDLNLNGQIDFSGPDVVSSNTTAYVNLASAWWRESRQYAFPETGSATPLLVSTSRQRLSGLGGSESTVIGTATLVSESVSIDALGNTSTRKSYLNRDTHATASVSTAPSSTLPSYSIAVGGLTLTNCTSSGIVSSRAYDALGRTVASTDGRGSTTTLSYDAQGRVAYSEDALNNRTTLGYDALGRQTAVTNELGEATFTAYDAENQVVSTWGATYPVAYAYDAFGRMTAMNTFRDEAMQQGDTTTWLYDDATGLLTNKVYSDGKGPSYSYTPDGKLAARTWARGITTTYAYTTSGQLTGIDYSDDTPDVSFTYDRLGRQLSAIADGVSTNLYAYSLFGQLTNEIVSGNAALSRTYDTLGRSTGYALDEGGATPSRLAEVSYGYDAHGRFQSVSSAQSADTFSYFYLDGSSLVSGMTASSGHAWTRSYESERNLISAVENTYGSTVISAFGYENDAIGRRTAIARSGTAFDTSVRDAYGYNVRSEVTSARRALVDNPNQSVRGFSYDYAYDPIGNRITSTEYDHEDTARMSSYTANALNQYTQRTVPGYAGVRGSATNNATVTVNGNPSWRLGEYFYGGDDADNAVSAVMKELDITAVVNPPGTNDADIVQSVTGKVFVAKSPEAFTYDDDGNMLSDGRFVYTWDGENRLASLETAEAAASVGAPRVRVEYAYDHRSRRIEKLVSHFENETWTVAESRAFLYDSWNMIQETIYNQQSAITNSFVWGLDLSGTLQGAGGVGGLLAVSMNGNISFPAFDGNGNICDYSSTDGTIVAHYEYSSFGETVVQFGVMADTFTFRFSTKYWENEAKLYYYGYRFYVPESGRWLNRDPVGENGGLNVFSTINNMISSYDIYGLKCCLITMGQGGKSVSGHSMMKCDDGLYISWNPNRRPYLPWWIPGMPISGNNHSEVDDFGVGSHYGEITSGDLMNDGDIETDKGRKAMVVCLDCLDGKNLPKPEDGGLWGGSWNPGNNCADETLRAADEGLNQDEPKCPPCYHPENILARNLIQTPQNAEKKFQELKAAGCSKWKCVLNSEFPEVNHH